MRAMHLVVFAALFLLGCSEPAASPSTPRPTTEESPRPSAPTTRTPIGRFGSARLRHLEGVSAIAFSPDGSKLASASQDGLACVWDVASGRELARLNTKDRFGEFVGFLPDGKRVLVGSIYGPCFLWEFEKPEDPKRMVNVANAGPANESLIDRIALSRDGEKFVTVTENAARLWRTSNGDYLGHAEIPVKERLDRGAAERIHARGGAGFRSAAFMPDGRTIVLGGSDDRVRIWDPEKETLHAFAPTGEAVQAVAASPDGKQIAASSMHGLTIYDAASEAVITSATHPAYERWWGGEAVAFSPDGKSVALTQPGLGRVSTFDATSGSLVRALETGGAAMSIAWSPDGKMLATGAWGENRIQLWDLATGKELPRPSEAPGSPVTRLEISPDGRSLVVGSEKGVFFLDPATGVVQKRINGEHGVWSVGLARDGSRVVTSGGGIHLWSWADGSHVRQLFKAEKDAFSVAISPDGETIAAATGDGSIRFWRASGEEIARTRWDAHVVAFSPDGRTVVAAGRGVVLFWDFDGKKLQARATIGCDVSDLVFTRDGKKLVCSGAKAVTILDASTRTVLQRLSAPSQLTRVASSADERWIAATGYSVYTGAEESKRVFLWDAKRGALVQVFEGHTGEVTAVAFSADGNFLYTGSRDSTILVWDLKDLPK